MKEIFDIISPGELILSILFVQILLNILLFSGVMRKFFQKHIGICMLITYLCGFVLYIIGFNFGASANVFTTALRACVASLEMFASRSELVEISDSLKEGSTLYMACFAAVHFMAVILALAFILEVFGKRLLSSFELIALKYGRPDQKLYIFDGAGKEDMLLAETLPAKEKKQIIFIKGAIDTDIKKFSFTDLLISGIKSQDSVNLPKNSRILYTSMPLSYALAEKKGRLYKRLFDMIRRYKAAEIFFISDDSKSNADAAYDLSRELTERKLTARIYAGVNGHDPYTYKLDSQPMVIPVNRSELRVSQLMDCTPLCGDGIGRDTLIIGFGHTGKECLVRLEERGFNKIDVVSKNSKYSNFLALNPQITRHEGYHFHDFGTSDDKYWVFLKDNLSRIRNVIVFGDDDGDSYTASIRLVEFAIKTGINMNGLRIYVMHDNQNSAVYAKSAKDKYDLKVDIFFPFGSYNSIYDYEMIAHKEKKVSQARKAGIDAAIRLAETKFQNEIDLDGMPAVLHLIAVGMAGKTEDEMIVGFLHDVVEDTSSDFEQLRRIGFSDEVLEALKLCTHDKSISYDEYVERIIKSGNKTAINVKINDLNHNLSRGRASLEKAIAEGDEAKIANLKRINAKHEKALAMIQGQVS